MGRTNHLRWKVNYWVYHIHILAWSQSASIPLELRNHPGWSRPRGEDFSKTTFTNLVHDLRRPEATRVHWFNLIYLWRSLKVCASYLALKLLGGFFEVIGVPPNHPSHWTILVLKPCWWLVYPHDFTKSHLRINPTTFQQRPVVECPCGCFFPHVPPSCRVCRCKRLTTVMEEPQVSGKHNSHAIHWSHFHRNVNMHGSPWVLASPTSQIQPRIITVLLYQICIDSVSAGGKLNIYIYINLKPSQTVYWRYIKGNYLRISRLRPPFPVHICPYLAMPSGKKSPQRAPSLIKDSPRPAWQ